MPFNSPNTSDAMTGIMAAEARGIAAPGTRIDTCAAPFGSDYISTRGAAAVAGHALLAAMARNFDDHDIVIVGAFIVPAVTAAAKEMCPVPLIATGEAGLAAASLVGQTIAILAIGPPARRMTEETVAASGLADRVVSIRDIGQAGTALTEDQTRVHATAVRLVDAKVAEDRADVIVLAAGSMAWGMVRRIQPDLPVPVVSSVGRRGVVAQLRRWRIHFTNPCVYTRRMSKPSPAAIAQRTGPTTTRRCASGGRC